MFVINELLIKRIFTRVAISFIFCIFVLLFTGSIADSSGYTGVVEFKAIGARTQFANSIFKLFPSYGNLLITTLLLSIISSTVVFISIKDYINEKNIFEWNLILYLPSLLIYASAPSKESLFFIPALLYIIIECEHLIKNKNKNNFFLYTIKIFLLYFMYQLRGILSLPYISLAIFSFLFKTLNLNLIIIRRLKFTNLLLFSCLISITMFIFTDSEFILNQVNILHSNFDLKANLSRRFDISLISDIYNPLNFIKIQFLSFYPSILETIKKPYTLLITYESTIFLYLFFKTWKSLFFLIKNDNQSKLFFSVIFIIITCSYFLIYGMVGYINVGSSQRFKTNFIPISLILPFISQILIRNKLSMAAKNR